ncbi:MAG: murein hydrolase activator EnvC family protein [Actinomycetota bacterium]
MRRPIAFLIVVAAFGGLCASAPATAAGIDLVQPVAGPIIRHYEQPPDPYSAGHRGLDFAAREGSIVVAAASGTVAFAGPVGGTIALSIDHADGYRTTYSYLDAVLVKKGQNVVQGQAIARSGIGHPGESPAHLHFGVRLGSDYVDPEPLLLASIRRNLWRVVWLGPIP